MADDARGNPAPTRWQLSMNYDDETPWKRSAAEARRWAAERARVPSIPELTLIRPILESACSKEDIGFGRRQREVNRGLRFIDELARAMTAHYASRPDSASIRVLCKTRDAHRAELGLDGLAYDIVACEVALATAPGEELPHRFVSRALWQIVTGFDTLPWEAITRFNKLVLGSASAKLFIGEGTANDVAYLRSLWPAARCCSGAVYVALITSPAKWHREPLSVTLWLASERGWLPV